MIRKSVLLLTSGLILFHYVSTISLAYTNIGSILKVKKDVFRIRNMDKSPAKPKMTLALNDAVETGRSSRVKLSFRDNSIINLGELSRMEIEEYTYSRLKKNSKSVYKLIEGSLKVIVGRSNLKIHTQSAVVAARGTEFIVWIGTERGKMFTGVIMIEGETTAESAIEGVEGKVIVRKGQMCRIFMNEPPERPRSTDIKIMDRFRELSGEVQSRADTSAKKSKVTGEVLNKADIKDSSNVAVGGGKANTGSVVLE